MTQPTFKCRICQGETKRGFLNDQSGSHGDFLANWVEGEPENSTLWGSKSGALDNRGKRKFGIKAVRCERCGYLEFYGV